MELSEKLQKADLPYTLRLHGVTEEMFEELADEDTRAELFEGDMIVHSPVWFRPARIGNFIRALLLGYTDEKDLGIVNGPDTLIRIAPRRQFAPDAYFAAKDRIPDPPPEKLFNGVPDLVAEILSPSNRDYDLEVKRPAYRKAGVAEIWIIDPESQEILVDRKRKRGYATIQVKAASSRRCCRSSGSTPGGCGPNHYPKSPSACGTSSAEGCLANPGGTGNG
jgi:Uma2 family endonuclease